MLILIARLKSSIAEMTVEILLRSKRSSLAVVLSGGVLMLVGHGCVGGTPSSLWTGLPVLLLVTLRVLVWLLLLVTLRILVLLVCLRILARWLLLLLLLLLHEGVLLWHRLHRNWLLVSGLRASFSDHLVVISWHVGFLCMNHIHEHRWSTSLVCYVEILQRFSHFVLFNEPWSDDPILGCLGDEVFMLHLHMERIVCSNRVH